MNDTLHPARSTEFLSRLHDGEVPAAEAAAFTTHRAACAECRDAARGFADSLAAFRSAEPSPAAADLSARILRKIRAQSPSRRPFGVMFGIDVRWAGVFVAALLVVLISAPALLRRPESVVRPDALRSIPARIVDAAPSSEAAPASPPRKDKESRAAVPPPHAVADAPAEREAKDEAAASPAQEAVAVPSAPVGPGGESVTEEETTRPSAFAAAPRAKAAAPIRRRQVTTTEPSGGEAGAANALDAIATAPHLSIRAVDGQGPAPAIASHPPDERFAALRGSEFVLVVEAQGRVRDVLPSAGEGFLSKRETPVANASQAASPLDALRALRFAPGDRPRRLLVRIE